jgi:Uma2 family endonuclease
MSDVWSAFPALGSEAVLRKGKALSNAEWLALPEDEQGELVGGYLEEEEVADAIHELAVSWLIFTLRFWLGASGVVLGSELKLLVAAKTGRKADVVVYLPGSQLPQRRGAVTLPPDILIEVVSSSPRDERRDRIEKMTEYAEFGVKYYWLLDPALGSLEIFELTSGRYAKAVAQTSGRIEPVPGCHGLVLDLDALWTELQRLPQE